ncbi:MAG TPA: hypothetical protein VHZ04_03150 [Candidatus Paceibacterota bacterium]|jgi:hypothetical protein|nr:hypothetical protein [Candidatus Paceibacterota bacterium]
MAKAKKKIKAKKKKPAAQPKRGKKKAKAPKAPKHIGEVTHFYTEIGVAIVKFNKKVPVGAELHFLGATTDFKDTAKSMQYDHKPVAAAPKGKEVGIKVKKRVREGDKVHFAK